MKCKWLEKIDDEGPLFISLKYRLDVDAVGGFLQQKTISKTV